MFFILLNFVSTKYEYGVGNILQKYRIFIAYLCVLFLFITTKKYLFQIHLGHCPFLFDHSFLFRAEFSMSVSPDTR
jgi:hypothetical protein